MPRVSYSFSLLLDSQRRRPLFERSPTPPPFFFLSLSLFRSLRRLSLQSPRASDLPHL
ncbi:hypothetical protein QJS04_geneDACA022139 [Acorus gramineus]|uniref:Uncharacterized protein n=1 Tax=Acorus gramineus TaxID=55184 RepID=A0AAV9AV97_ACOGR|nr:hypothetical protein QJS04_geneDACA022139 [Acorus gramineus]